MIKKKACGVQTAMVNKMVIESAISKLIPKIKGSPIFSSAERIFQPITDFIRGNPIVSTASVGAGVTGLVAGIAVVKRLRKKPKKKAKRKKKRSPKKRKKKVRRRSKRACPKRRRRKTKRKIIRGRGLGTKEIRHSGKSTKGKFKVVSFRDKRTGKMVRFKAKR